MEPKLNLEIGIWMRLYPDTAMQQVLEVRGLVDDRVVARSRTGTYVMDRLDFFQELYDGGRLEVVPDDQL